MERTRLYLMRHGQVAGFEEKRYNGQADVPLTQLGVQQFELLAERLESLPIAAIYSSDLSRCANGSQLLSERLGLQAVTMADFRERHIGQWEGHTWQELQELYPREWAARLQSVGNFRVPGGESPQDVHERVMPALQEILQRHAGQDVALVGHGGVNRVILLNAIGAPLDCLFHIEQDYGCLNIIDYQSEGGALVRLLNG